MPESNMLMLRRGKNVLLRHSEARPFATAVRQEKTYSANRGTVKTAVREAERIPLTAVKQEGASVVLSGGGHSLRITMEKVPLGCDLALEGEDDWSYEFRLPAKKDEAVFGGGEQYRQVNHRGERVVNFVSEHIKASTIVEKALLPRALYREKPHSAIGSYAPMPVFMTDRNRLILFDTPSDGTADFTAADEFRFFFDRCPKRLTLLSGKNLPELCRALAAYIPNRQYLPDWCFEGMILGVQGGTETILRKAFAMLDAGAKVSAVWSQDWSGELRTVMGKQVWWNWEADEKLYPNLREAIGKLNARGVRFLAYINPYLVRDGHLYHYCKDKGWLIRNRDGEVYHIQSTTFDAGMLDLTHPDAVAYIKEVLIGQNMLDLGVSGWMADFGEYLPVDCVLHDGDPAELHNVWPVLWAKINREAIEARGKENEAMFFTRSGYLGIQQYAPIMWNGDQHTDTTRDYGMPCVMPASFSLGFSGVPMVHCDIGGFFSFAKMKRSKELFVRWMEMGAFSLLMRSHESIRPWANAQFDASGVTPFTVKLTRAHVVLRPYLEHCMALAQEGLPVLRPDFFPENDAKKGQDPYAYFLGEDLFVCPVIREGERVRTVHLPKGEWVHLWTGEPFAGGKKYRVDAPLGQLPVFYRKNSPFTSVFQTAGKNK
jgi:alpha-glucosidase